MRLCHEPLFQLLRTAPSNPPCRIRVVPCSLLGAHTADVSRTFNDHDLEAGAYHLRQRVVNHLWGLIQLAHNGARPISARCHSINTELRLHYRYVRRYGNVITQGYVIMSLHVHSSIS